MVKTRIGNSTHYLMEMVHTNYTGDMNDLTSVGSYLVIGSETNNTPEAGYLRVLVFGNPGALAQIAVSGNGNMYYRFGNPNGFYPWKKVTAVEINGGGS